MAVTYTENYNLGKQENHSDKFDMAVITENMDKIDTALADKVDKESGKGLSTNDFTDADKSKLDGLENYDDTDVKDDIAKVASQAAVNRSTLGHQRKNFLPNDAKTTTSGGVTFTVNSDGSVIANGTSTNVAQIIVNSSLYIESDEYILSGCPIDGGGGKYELEIQTDTVLARDYGNSAVVNLQSGTAYKVKIIIRSGVTANNLKFYPMVRLAEITDNTYEPYQSSVQEQIDSLTNHVDTDIAKIAEQSALNRSTLGYQAKNLLNNTAISKTVNGVTFTVNADKSVSVVGTATNAIAFLLGTFTQTSGLHPGKYVYSGCNSGSSSTYMLRYFNDDTSFKTIDLYNAGKIINHTVGSGNFAIIVHNGVTINTTFYPMFRPIEITDDTYEPHKPSVEERLAALEEKLAALEGGTT